MKVKTCVTGLNKKQLRSLALQLNAEASFNAFKVDVIRTATMKVDEENSKLKADNFLTKVNLQAKEEEILKLKTEIEQLRKENEKLYVEIEKPLWKKVLGWK